MRSYQTAAETSSPLQEHFWTSLSKNSKTLWCISLSNKSSNICSSIPCSCGAQLGCTVTVLIRLFSTLLQVIYVITSTVKAAEPKGWEPSIPPRDRGIVPNQVWRTSRGSLGQPAASHVCQIALRPWAEPLWIPLPWFCCCFHSHTAWKSGWSTAEIPLCSQMGTANPDWGQGCQSTAPPLKVSISAATVWRQGLRSLGGTIKDRLWILT